MQIIKPLQLTLLNRSFTYQKRFYLSLGAVYGFELSSGKSVLEQDLWDQLSECEELLLLDSAFPKQQAEFLVYGCAETPGGKPQKELTVDIQVGPIKKSLLALGKGYWRGLPGLKKQSIEEPFTRLPLTPAFSYGGEDYALNPEGLGQQKVKTPEDEEAYPVTQLQLLNKPATDPGKPLEQAFTSALDTMAEQRKPYAGTYDETYQAEAMPGLPDDFDFRFCQDALADQRFDSQYLPSQLKYRLKNLNADHPLIEGQVPEWNIKVTYLQEKQNEKEPLPQETSLEPETLFLFPNQNLGLVLCRGQVAVSRDDARDVKALQVAMELPKEPKTQEHYRDQIYKRTDQKNAWRYLMDTQPLLPSQLKCGIALLMSQGEMPKLELPQLDKVEELKKEQEAEAQKNLDEVVAQAQALDPNFKAPELPKTDTEDWQKKLEALQAKILPQKPDGSPDLANIDFDAMKELQKLADEVKEIETQKMLAAVLPELEALLQNPELKAQHEEIRQQIDQLLNPPQPSWPRPDLRQQLEPLQSLLQEHERDLAELNLPEEERQGLLNKISAARQAIVEQEEKLQEMEVSLKEAYLMGAEFQEKCAPVRSSEEQAAIQDAVLKALAANQPLPTSDLSDLDLSGAKLDGYDLSHCYMEGVNLAAASLKNAKLCKTILVHACLDGVDFSGSDLSEANLGSSQITASNFSSAQLAKARFNHSRVKDNSFVQANLDESLWLETEVEACDFSQASLRKLNLIEPEWKNCRFTQADLSQGNYVNARFADCVFDAINLEGTNFVELVAEHASFKGAKLINTRFVRGCQLNGCDFSEANLQLASFREASVKKGRFDRANMEQADLELGDFTASSFERTNLFRANLANVNFTGCLLEDANLMEASLYHARVVQANLRGANLYAANFLYMEYGETRFDGANLDRTLLQDWRPPA
ncbi:DUF2169 family type VI secretion system accessory protein [Marinospirillum perlucidum]|uniref:DUF2169 family type VI secretion system accessory protein n=1 Tax=Marinospirillum perlucidum TaxID=1982602 RepID=UPI000DF202C2|nr:DUF2169 domain-containing protein [Marinospirillum perlucidum]